VLAIVGDNSKEFDENNNPVLNPTNIDRGANHLAEGQKQNPSQPGKKFDYQSTNGG
jgi:hypothetical protein